MHILKFDENVDVMATKAKPKRIQLFTTCGKTIKFLLKQEQNGDLRKDARMMDFNAVVNRCLTALFKKLV
jgi:serine/threonine-protein kinase ATR